MKTSLFWHLSAFLIGIISFDLFPIPASLMLVVLLFILALIFSRHSHLKFFFLLLAFFSLAHYRAHSITTPGINLESYFQASEIWSFWICKDPEPDWDKQIVIACPLPSVWPSETWQEKIILNMPLYPELGYGDVIDVKCKLDKPPSFEDFDYAAYLAAKGVGATCAWPQLISLEKNKAGKDIYRYLFTFKRQARFLINRSLPEPHSGLASSLLLGYKKTLYPTELEMVRRAGLNHIIVISGAHISLFVLIVIYLFIYLGLSRAQAIFPALLLTFLYVSMIGFPASAWRSLIMSSLLIYAWWRGRLQDIWTPLFLAAALMLYQKPLLWRHDLGFQLSFAALAGIISFQPGISSFLKRKFFFDRYVWSRLIANALSLSFAAQLTVWPIIALKIGGVSLFSPLSNVLAFIIFVPLILSLLIALMLSFLGWSWLWLWWPAYVFIEYFLRVCYFVASLPGAYFEIDNFNLTQTLLYYFCLVLIVRYLKKRGNKYSGKIEKIK
jgi:competence protein ComEC